MGIGTEGGRGTDKTISSPTEQKQNVPVEKCVHDPE